MGTYMDLVVETRLTLGYEWRAATVSYRCPFGGGCHKCAEDNRHYGYSYQWYRVFAQLAGVRNEADFEPVASPKGLPPDYRGRELDAEYGFSWLTLHELLRYDRTREARFKGLVHRDAWLEWNGKGMPSEYRRGAYGYVVGSPEEARQNPKVELVAVEWTETYEEAGGHFWRHFVPALEKLGRSPLDVRIVFGFHD